MPLQVKPTFFLVPNVEAGNALVKMMIYFMGACAAGVVVGGKVPVVITSRADDVQARLSFDGCSCSCSLMKKLKNWDNKTWLSSKSYISQFNKFLKTKINLNKNSKILDIGCGRANIISALHKKYKFRNKPIGIDIVANKDVKKNIIFKKIGAIKIFKETRKI